ncbi:MAG: hypothetical protein ABR553_09345 [Gammaproteobacteria bacterium]
MKSLCSTVTLLSVIALSGPAMAEDWVYMPAFKPGWEPDFTLAAVGGALDVDHAGSGFYSGVELSLNCPWFQPPTGQVRQQFNIGTYDDDMEITSFELNPNYFMTLSPGVTFGVGPGVGYARASYRNGPTEGLWSVQASANLNYRSGSLFLGAGARYQDTRDKTLAPGVRGADNWLLSAKVGINF